MRRRQFSLLAVAAVAALLLAACGGSSHSPPKISKADACSVFSAEELEGCEGSWEIAAQESNDYTAEQACQELEGTEQEVCIAAFEAERGTPVPQSVIDAANESSQQLEEQVEAKAEAESESEERQISFHMTDGDGWEYEGVLPYPEPEADFKKNIRSSPPGSAKVEASFWVEPPGEDLEFSDTNPGRPNGPTLTVTPGYFAYGLPSWAENGNTFSGPFEFGPCDWGDNADYDFEPYNAEFKCDTTNEETEGLSENGVEAEVERLVHVLNNEQPSYVVNLDPISASCNVFIEPDGSIRRNGEFKPNCRERMLHLKVK